MIITTWLDFWTTNSAIWFNDWKEVNLIKLWNKTIEDRTVIVSPKFYKDLLIFQTNRGFVNWVY